VADDGAAPFGTRGRRRAALTRPAAVGTTALATGTAALFAAVAPRRRPPAVDVALHAAALAHRTPGRTTAALTLTDTTGRVAHACAALGGLLAFGPRTAGRLPGTPGARVLGALVGSAVLGVGQLVRWATVDTIRRARPPVADGLGRVSGHALPSGHTTTATLGAGLLCLGLGRAARGPWRAAAVAVPVCWAAAVGVARVYLGVHWPTDVLAGWLSGALAVSVAALLLPPLP
jgi:undecaprenyl-diphosphatase